MMPSQWIPKPRKSGAPQKSCQNNVLDALNNVFQATMPNRVDDKGVFKTWTHIAKDKGMWNFLATKCFKSFRQSL